MWPDRDSNPGPLTYESGALPIALPGPASFEKGFKGFTLKGKNLLLEEHIVFLSFFS